jgi:hypothetical protein
MNSADFDTVRFEAAAPARRGETAARAVLVLCEIAALVLSLALLLPAGRWLTRMEMSGWRWPGDGSPVYPVTARDLERAAAAMPRDGVAQAALLAWNRPARGTRSAVSDSLSLARRFPSGPAVLAAALRLARSGPALRPPADTAVLVGIAERGAEADPRNAFFPVMRASVLLRAKRDGEALASLYQAEALPAWNEYAAEEVRAGWRLSDTASGGPNTAMRGLMAIGGPYSSPAFDAYADERLSRLAANAEKSGHVGDAYRIRRALMRVGEKMRHGSTTFTGTIVGMALQRAATDDLLDGQQPRVRSDTNKRRAAYDALLRRAGHPADIAWTHSQHAMDDAIERVLFRAAGPARREAISAFRAWYDAGRLLLHIALRLTFAAGILGLLNRWRFAHRVIGGYREAALLTLAAACLCVIAYGYVTMRTLRVSTRVNRSLATMLEDEPRFITGLDHLHR